MQKSFKKHKKQNYFCLNKIRQKILVVFYVFLFITISVKLFYVSLFQQNNETSNREISEQFREYRRNIILDRNGQILATDIDTVSLYFNRDLIKSPREIAVAITKILDDVEVNSLFNRLNNRGNTKYVLVKRNLTPKEELKVKRLGIAGTTLIKDKRRLYPHKNLFAHVIGYTDIDRNGISGLEKQYDKYLKSEETKTLQTTLDLRVQGITREILLKGMQNSRAKSAVAVVANTKTGEILSAVSLPDFNPNYLKNTSQKEKFDQISFGVYEMGSIFKIFNTALGLEKNIISVDTIYEVGQPIRYGKFTIGDARLRRTSMNVEDILIHSSNIGSAKIARDIGVSNQIDFFSNLGLLEKVKADFPSLAAPLFPRVWREINLMTMSFGHGIAVTPLHLVRATSGIVNDGILHNIKFTNQVKDEPERIISKNTSDIMKKLMRKTVTDGTGWRSNVSGYSVGGKTGTAEEVSQEGGYNKNQIRATFIATFPIDNPQTTIFVMLEDPRTSDSNERGLMDTGGSVAAPIVGDIIKNIASILGVEPDK
jgi:cell division protein FtsI (penicillin-binding protein 3)